MFYYNTCFLSEFILKNKLKTLLRVFSIYVLKETKIEDYRRACVLLS